MTLKFKLAARALDGAAAAILAAAVAYAVTVLAAVELAAAMTPPLFFLVYAVLRQIEDAPVHRLAEFQLQALDLPRPAPIAVDGDGTVVHLFEQTAPADGRSATSPDDGAPDRAVRDTGDAGRALSEALAALKSTLR
jgi:hypothetical protein